MTLPLSTRGYLCKLQSGQKITRIISPIGLKLQKKRKISLGIKRIK